MKHSSETLFARLFAMAATIVIVLLLSDGRTECFYHAWGEPTGQLQLASILNTKTGIVGMWLRSTATNELFVHMWSVGYIESIEPEILTDGRWVRLPIARLESWGLQGIGPQARDIRKLAPRDEMFSRPRDDQSSNFNETSGLTKLDRLHFENVSPQVRKRWKRIERALGTPTSMISLDWLEWPTAIQKESRVTIRAKQRLAIPFGVRIRPKNPDGTMSYETGEPQSREGPPPYVTAGYRWVNVYSQPIELDSASLMAAMKVRKW